MQITLAIPSTTHVDRHFERMAKEALESMAEQVNSRYIPLLIEHDFDRQIGVNLCAAVKPLAGVHYALVGVCGIFESPEERKFFKNGATNTVYRDFIQLIENLDLSHIESKSTIPTKYPETIADWLELHLDSTKVLDDGTVYKVKHFITSIGDLSVEVYPLDHEPNSDHFHIISKQRRMNARFHIDTLEYIDMKNGTIRKKDIKKVQNFFEQHPYFLKKLRSEHLRLNPNKK